MLHRVSYNLYEPESSEKGSNHYVAQILVYNLYVCTRSANLRICFSSVEKFLAVVKAAWVKFRALAAAWSSSSVMSWLRSD